MRPIEVLYQLQQTELRLEAIKKDLETLDSGEALEAEANRLSAVLAKDREILKGLRQELLDQELELNDMEAKLRKLEDLLASGSLRSGREVEHMQKELEEVRRRKDLIETRMLEIMLKAEETERQLKEREELLEQTKEQLAKVRQQAAVLKETLTKEQAALLEEREKLKAMLAPEVLSRYEQLKARLGGVAVAKIEGNLCGACRVTITAEIVRALRDPEGLPRCENCGRFLFGEV